MGAMKTSITIATRESPLALWQANWVKTKLSVLYPDLRISLLGLTTEADRLLSRPLYEVGGKGLFVKELEEALLDKRADIAVHSMKDVPVVLPAGLQISALCEREDPRDAFISNRFTSLDSVPAHSVIGTSSLRRQSQLAALNLKVELKGLRGNVNTRLKKLEEGEFDAIILAAAGLKRLGFLERVTAYLPTSQMLPAAGQGVLGIESREADTEIHELIAPLNHEASEQCVETERVVCRHLQAGCQVPVAVFATLEKDTILVKGLVGSVDGKTMLRAEASGKIEERTSLGIQVAEALLEQGAGELLKQVSLKHGG